MIFPQTAEKLSRSNRLLEMLRRWQGDPLGYEALLDAVVNEGRSVTFVLQSEMTQPGLSMDKWYEAEQAKMRLPENSALPWLNEARRLSTHQEPLGVGTAIEAKFRNPPILNPGEKFGVTPKGEMFYEQFEKDGTLRRTIVQQSDMDVKMYRTISNPSPPKRIPFDGVDFTGKDAVTIVAAYLDYIGKLVERAEAEAVKQVLRLKFGDRTDER
jgi:hypothetical protein